MGPVQFNIYIRTLYNTVHNHDFNIHGFVQPDYKLDDISLPDDHNKMINILKYEIGLEDEALKRLRSFICGTMPKGSC